MSRKDPTKILMLKGSGDRNNKLFGNSNSLYLFCGRMFEELEDGKRGQDGEIIAIQMAYITLLCVCIRAVMCPVQPHFLLHRDHVTLLYSKKMVRS